MASFVNLNKSQYLFSRYLVVVLANKLLKHGVYNRQKFTTTLDVCDEFVTPERRCNKWGVMHRTTKVDNVLQSQYKPKIQKGKLFVQSVDFDQLNTLLKDAIGIDNKALVKEIVNEYSERGKLPTVSVLSQVLSYYSQMGNKDAVLNIIHICNLKLESSVLHENSHFKHYLAKATWIKGNVYEAINLFDDVYRSNVRLRRKIRSMLKYLIYDTVSNHSEVALMNTIAFAEQLVKDFKDFYLLACIWQICFLSEWFTDQSIAINLLERHRGLCQAVAGQIPFVITVALNNHKVEPVQRLLEVLLKLEQKTLYVVILESLFDYRVQQGDLRGCSEIIQWSLNEGVTLPAIQQEKFVDLLVAYKPKSLRNTSIQKIKLKPPRTPQLQFKF